MTSRALALGLVLAAAASGQSKRVVQAPWPAPLPQPPAWPGVKMAASAPEGPVVFRGPTGDLIVYIPPRQHRGTGQELPGFGPVTYELATHSRPSVETSVARAGAAFRYTMRIANGREAKKPIISMFLSVPEAEDPAWSVLVPEGRTSFFKKRALDGCGTYSIGTRPHRSVVLWSRQIEPGSSLDGIVITSSLMPGINLSFLASDRGLPDWVELMPDDEERYEDELHRFSECYYEKTIVYVVGPRFLPDTPAREMARHFSDSLDALVRERRLTGKSAWFAEAKEWLKEIAASGQRAQRPMKAAPEERFEREIGEAMRLSLLAGAR